MALVYRMCAGNIYSRAFVVIIGAAAAAVFWSVRPQMVSFFLSTVVLYLLYLFKRQQKDFLWAIPPLMVLWVNLHAGFAIGFILLLGFMIGEARREFLRSNQRERGLVAALGQGGACHPDCAWSRSV